QPAGVRDVSGLGRPGRYRAQARHHQQQTSLLRHLCRRGAVRQDAFENLALWRRQRCIQRSEVPVFRGDGRNRRGGTLEGLSQLLEAEFRQGIAPAQRQKIWHFEIGESLKQDYSLTVVWFNLTHAQSIYPSLACQRNTADRAGGAVSNAGAAS